eukprot:m.20871 g.20871  ORF g.20871 m.20871 type:complete len:222 (+) comp11061_c0_seq1:183-848(+)
MASILHARRVPIHTLLTPLRQSLTRQPLLSMARLYARQPAIQPFATMAALSPFRLQQRAAPLPMTLDIYHSRPYATQPTTNRSEATDIDSHHDNSHHDNEEKEKQHLERLTVGQRLKYLITRYGKVAAGVYFILGTADLTLYYTAISMGLDVEPMLETVFSQFGLHYKDFVSKSMGAFVAAYTIHKLMTPPRVILTASITPSLARRLAKSYPKWFGRAPPS